MSLDDAMFHWFESLVDVFPKLESETPRHGVALLRALPRPLWPLFWQTLVAAAARTVEVAMFGFLARIVDRVAEQPDADSSPARRELLWMAGITLTHARILALHNLLVNQSIGRPQQPHALLTHNYVVAPEPTFFQNDVAGPIANRVMQTGTSLRESACRASMRSGTSCVHRHARVVVRRGRSW